VFVGSELFPPVIYCIVVQVFVSDCGFRKF
jgi:hypothetical protein